MKRTLPRYVTEFADRHGKYRLRFRRTGQASYYFKARFPSESFYQEYAACLSGEAAPHIQPGAGRSKDGSISDLIERFYRSPQWLGMKAESSRRTYRGIIEHFRDAHGAKAVATVRTEHLDAILGKMANTPAAANNLRKVLRRLFGYAVKIGMRPDNPALMTDGFKTSGEGFHTWTEEEIGQFEAHHVSGTRARLALALMLWTGQRRSDVIHLGRQHVKGDCLHLRQQKTGKLLSIPIAPALMAEIRQVPAGQMTFLVTQHGKAFTGAGFGNWFRRQCDAAGLSECSAHGLRKAMARRLAEMGATHSQGKAITGHTKDAQFSHYAEKANQAALAGEAMANLAERLDKNNTNTLKKGA